MTQIIETTRTVDARSAYRNHDTAPWRHGEFSKEIPAGTFGIDLGNFGAFRVIALDVEMPAHHYYRPLSAREKAQGVPFLVPADAIRTA
jgi:hypothetical protein